MTRSHRRLLDLGCGHGSRAEELLAAGELVGVDLDAGVLAGTRARHPRGRFCRMRGERLAFRDASFDEFHAYDVLEHVDDLDAALAEMARVLSPGARVVIEVPASASETILLALHPGYFEQSHHRRKFAPAEWLAALNRHGVRVERVAGRKLFENLCLAYFFARGRDVRNQQGELAPFPDAVEDDRPVEALLELTLHAVSELAARWTPEERRAVEERLGAPLEEAGPLVRALDGLGARFFPKTFRLEGTYTGGAVRQDWAEIAREPLPSNTAATLTGERELSLVAAGEALAEARRERDGALRREAELLEEIGRRQRLEEEKARAMEESTSEVRRLVALVEERQRAVDRLAGELRDSEARRVERESRYQNEERERSEREARMVEDVARQQKVNEAQYAEVVALTEKVARLVAAYEERQNACDSLSAELAARDQELRRILSEGWARRLVRRLTGGGPGDAGATRSGGR